MQESLKLRISLQRQQNLQIYPLQEIVIEDEFSVPISLILRKVNDYIREEKIQIEQFLNIWVVTKNGRENLYKLKKKNIQLSVMANEEGHFELNIVLENIGQKGNILRNLHIQSQQYARLDNNINKIIEESKFEEEKNGQRAIRPIDIAYFFADPLVSVGGPKKEPKAIFEVSYQKEYDKFIEMVSKEALDNNLKIQMMVATETNIKNTLIDGVSIMHFACHGKNIVGNLQIESERPVGELVDFQHKTFMSLLEKKTLPKLIIFNVCFSSKLAKMITDEKKIMTIGYDNEANDNYCELFTREFYQGIFENQKSVRELFEKIKQYIMSKNEIEGKKLKLYPEIPFEDQDKEPLIASTQQNINWVQKWNLLQNMREKDPVGVKKQMYKFIKVYLTHSDRIEYLFFTGEPSSGKSLFMNKTRIYVMNRKVFNESIVIDLKNQSGIVQIDSMLRFKLNKQWLIDQKLAEFKELGKGTTVRALIIFDHFEKIIKYEYKKLINYITSKFINNRLKYGKIVIITNNIESIAEEDRKKYLIATKERPQLEDKQLTNLVNRYTQMKWDTSLMNLVSSIKRQKDYSPISIVQALKKSDKPENLEQNYQFFHENHKKKIARLNQEPQKAIQTLIQQITVLEGDINEEVQFVNIRIQQNDYIYLSTIFEEVALHKLSTYNLELKKTASESLSNRPTQGSNIKRLVSKIKVFLKTALRYYAAQFIGLIKFFIHISLKLAAVCYFHGEFDMFEQHLLNCQKFHVKMLSLSSQQLKKGKANEGEMEIQIQSLLRTYHLKILLSLYSYYSENKFKLEAKQYKTSEQKDKIFLLTKKAQVVLNQLLKQFAKKELSIVNEFIKNLHKINFIAQELHYRSEYKFLMHENTRRRKQSEAYDCLDQLNYLDIAKNIDEHHKKIVSYWKSFKQLEGFYNSSSVLSKDSLLLILLIVIKLIFFNISEMEQMLSKGDSFLQMKRIEYINQYIEIMDKIYCQGIFTNKVNKNSIFVYQDHECIRLLFKTYLKNYIVVYFQLQKYKQDITKEYNMRRYNELINLCDLSSGITTLSSIKKTIEMHISQQFFNTWTVKTFISCPLILKHLEREVKCNIKRYQQQIFKFQHILFKHELDKQINFQITLMNFNNLEKERMLCETSNKNLIYLIVCDCRENESKTDSDKIFMQSQTGEIIYDKITNVSFPQAPIVIVFGVNVDRLVAQYQERQSDSVIISINIQKFYTEMDFEKQTRIQMKLQNYAAKLEIYYIVLQYFYCSFCRHFFNAEHKLFIEQVRSSFHLAKAEALIKTKIRYFGVKFNQGDIIEDIVKNIDFNLPYLQDAPFASDLKTRPAYQFIYKQRKPNNATAMQNCRFSKIRNEIRSEIGCNLQLRQILTLIAYKKNENICAYYFYKSDDMLQYFIRSLKMKLTKQNLFIIEKALIGVNDYEQYRKSQKKKLKSLNEDHLESGEEVLREVQFFINLTDEQMLAEKESKDLAKKYKTVKIFFSKYSLSNQLIPSFNIEESYHRNKIEFELYFLEQMNIRNFRNGLAHPKFIGISRKIFQTNPNQIRLEWIKKEIEKQRNKHRG